jgi:glycogen operon protein
MKNNKAFKTYPGQPLPLGAHVTDSGTQFSVFSRHALSVTLVLFSDSSRESEYTEIELDPDLNKTGDIWHIWIEGIGHGQLYGYRVDGPYEPSRGHRFNRNKLLIDPHARAVTDNFTWDLTTARGYDPDSPRNDLSFSETDSREHVPRSIVISSCSYGDRPINIPSDETIIYELHLRGYTMHPSSGAAHPGTYRGLTEKIPYLKELGITSVELLPIQEFDFEENININPVTEEKLKNFWGYSTFAFFAPKGLYASTGEPGHQVDEFREMVKAFHDAGIEVILDVVFNHTAEGDEHGPTVSFRGFDNSIYYILDEDKRFYKNYSGCGNTMNCNHPLVREFILECLRYWVVEMNIDGFRFDLASILGRDRKGEILSNPPLIEKIEEDPILRNTKIIAEAWDAAGAYQVGDFPGRWAEWNGKYRDDVRSFWRGEPNHTGKFATRITGSSDLYGGSRGGPLDSINFITSHDGFTMNDLVSYNIKHNFENGENNRDGDNNNISYNYGIEGSEVTQFIDRVRLRQIKNLIATLFLSQGIPMLLAGDEFRRTQRGNNNAYCHDDEISWVDWGLLEENRELIRFTSEMIRFRKAHPLLRNKTHFTGAKTEGFSLPDITWHGHKPHAPDWSGKSHSIALLINGEYSRDKPEQRDCDIYMIFNASKINRWYHIPEAPSGASWKRAIDTSLGSPRDILDSGKEEEIGGNRYYVRKMSTVVLTAQPAR